jgi:hypothetical protein
MCFYVLSTVRFYEVWDGFWNLYMLLYTWHLPLKKIKIHQHNHRLSQAHNKHGTSFLLICVANLTLFSSNVNRLTLKSWAMTIKWPNNCRPWAQCRHATARYARTLGHSARVLVVRGCVCRPKGQRNSRHGSNRSPSAPLFFFSYTRNETPSC